MELRTTSCCGVLEVANIATEETPKAIIRKLLPALRDNTAQWSRGKPYLFFTGLVGPRVFPVSPDLKADYGKNLADYIEQNNLGEVVRSIEPRPNWTGNTIKFYMWYPNWGALRRLDQITSQDQAQGLQAIGGINISI